MSEKISVEITLPEKGYEKFEVSYYISVDGEGKAGGVSSKKELLEKIDRYIGYLKPKQKQKWEIDLDNMIKCFGKEELLRKVEELSK